MVKPGAVVIDVAMNRNEAGKLCGDVDYAPVEEEMRQCALAVDGVLGVDSLRTRQFGSKLYVDMEVAADGNLTLIASHEIAEAVHDKLELTFPEVKHCMVHVNPR